MIDGSGDIEDGSVGEGPACRILQGYFEVVERCVSTCGVHKVIFIVES